MPVRAAAGFRRPLAQDVEDALHRLLRGDLDFHAERSDQGPHSFHAFPAKFPPQLPRAFIEKLTLRGETVLDPMVGSGTTAVEALALGRKAVACDLDPLARLITQVKTTPIQVGAAASAGEEAVNSAALAMWDSEALDRKLVNAHDEETFAFIDYWFLPHTQRELTALTLAIREVDRPDVRRFLRMVLSSIVITKSGGVSRARDLAHTRPWRDKKKRSKGAIEEFRKRLTRLLSQLPEGTEATGSAYVCAADCRALPVASESVDLIVTSPPYAANAIDYMRANKFSLVWLGMSIKEGRELRSQYVGSDKIREQGLRELPQGAGREVARVAQEDQRKASTLARYFDEMTNCLSEMARVLKHGHSAVLVVGPSTLRGVRVSTHECLAEIGEALGLTCVGITQRKLDRNRRMMPARFGGKRGSLIEERMHEEYVIGFVRSRAAAQLGR